MVLLWVGWRRKSTYKIFQQRGCGVEGWLEDAKVSFDIYRITVKMWMLKAIAAHTGPAAAWSWKFFHKTKFQPGSYSQRRYRNNSYPSSKTSLSRRSLIISLPMVPSKSMRKELLKIFSVCHLNLCQIRHGLQYLHANHDVIPIQTDRFETVQVFGRYLI